MTESTLERFVARMRASWGPLRTELVTNAHHHMEELARAEPHEPWLAALHAEGPASRELHRDARHGFVLLAHTEPTGLRRAPHDHGLGWVVYAVQRGEVVMSTYARHESDDGPRLVQRDETVLRAGQAKLFLPGDIHDTRCVSGPALLFRFTDRDLEEEKRLGRLTRYVERGGVWTVGP